MLALKRKPNESVTIGDDITVHVVSIGGGQVKLAFDAPKHIRIMRSELHGKDKTHGKHASPVDRRAARLRSTNCNSQPAGADRPVTPRE